ncbi:MAG: polysaccharide biosynthesis C-terminal domain-containing protein [Calditrichaeota bacterium]|nr:polysaccharide biosynthesis C-terminal domain-containing protein [Calditrichota bacterium]HQU70875.1 polysaccharide biosynthesis C-terminal domain-containing protein [Calditrichia bacterium]
MAEKPASKGFWAPIRGLARHSAIYAISTALQKLPGLLLLPIYTSFDYLPSYDDYADVVMLYTFGAFMGYVFTYGMDSAMMRYFFLGKADRKTVFSTTMVFLLFSSGLTALLMTLGAPQLAELLLGSSAKTELIYLITAILFFDALGNLAYLVLRAEEKAGLFTVFKGLKFFMEMGFNVWFLVFWHLQTPGIFYAGLAASALNLLMLVPIILKYFKLRPDLRLWREMLLFALPLLPNGIAFTTTEMMDRFLVKYLLNADALAVYGASYKFGSALLLLVMAFRNAWQPFFLKTADRPDAQQLYARVMSYFVTGAALIVLIGTLFLEDLLTLTLFGYGPLLKPAYWAGIGIIPVILLSYVFYGMYVILTPGFYIRKKSQYMILFTGSAGLSNVIANFILLPWLQSFWGAAWATLISYVAMALSIYWVGQRLYPIQLEWARLAKVFSLLGAVMLIYYSADPDFGVRLTMAVMILVTMAIWILTPAERKMVLRRVGL